MYFLRGDQSQDAEKRNLFAFTARLTLVAGMTACPMLFFRHFDRILDPPENELPAEVDTNDLIILADYFRTSALGSRRDLALSRRRQSICRVNYHLLKHGGRCGSRIFKSWLSVVVVEQSELASVTY